VPLGATDGTVDEVFHSGFFGGIGEVHSLYHFAFRPDGLEILYAVRAMDATKGSLERGGIF
jgi:hypothetical protein